MREPGNYILEFKSQNLIDIYEIIVSKEKIIIEPKEQNFSNTTSQTTERLPEHLLWVKCSYDWRVFDPNDNQCSAFFNEIATETQPYLDSNNNKTLKLQYYIYEGDIEILLDIAKKYDSKGHFILFNRWNGQSMHSNNVYSHITKAYYPEPIITEYETEYKDTSQCDETASRVEYYGCMQNVALYTRDETICEYAAYDPDKCYNDIGKATLNEALCTQLAFWKNYYRDCFEYIAEKKQDPTICENIDNKPDKGDCYENYAVKTGDEKYCEKAFFKDRCYKK